MLDGADALGSGLALLVDELAHGMVVATAEGRVLHANQAARQELARRQVLSLEGGRVCVADAEERRLLHDALAKAAGGLRSLVTLRGCTEFGMSVAVVPLRTDGTLPPVVALMFSRASVCDALMLCFFARSHRLTPMEEQVLAILCQGYSAPEIAAQLKVAVSTVRSHVRSMCAKTQSSGVRVLVKRLAVLPPLRPSRLHEAVH